MKKVVKKKIRKKASSSSLAYKFIEINRMTLGILIFLCISIAALVFSVSQQKQLYSRAAGTAMIINHTNTSADGLAQADLDKARDLDVVFNHQSVGANILSGIDALASENATRYTITRTSNPAVSWYDTNSGIGDFMQGSNGDPASKVNGFDSIMRGGLGAKVQVAFMKFCFVDFGSGQTIWNLYKPKMEALIVAYPNVKFVWWTAPLETTSGNTERAIFNNFVRQYVTANGGLLFDIADIESHDPSGNAVKDSTGSEALYSGYASDTGHLNATGSKLAAGAIWNLLVKTTTTTTTSPTISQPVNTVPSAYCLGGIPCTSPSPSIIANPSLVQTSQAPQNPSVTAQISNPVPSTNPCITTQSANSASVQRYHRRSPGNGGSGNSGFFQQLLEMIMKLLQQLFQMLGLQSPDTGGTPTNPSPSTSPCPSIAPSSTP